MAWRKLEEVAEVLAGLTRNELVVYNDCFGTRGLKVDDQRIDAPPDPPPDPDSFCNNPHMTGYKLEMLMDLTGQWMFWTKDDLKKLDALLKPHNLQLLTLETTYKWNPIQ